MGWELLPLLVAGLAVAVGAGVALATEFRDDRRRRKAKPVADGTVPYGSRRVHEDCLVWLRDNGTPDGLCEGCRPALWGIEYGRRRNTRVEVDAERLAAYGEALRRDVERVNDDARRALRAAGLWPCSDCGENSGHRAGCKKEPR